MVAGRKTVVKETKKRLTEEEQVIKSLLASGAVEITPEMQQQEPYKSMIAKAKYDLLHEE